MITNRPTAVRLVPTSASLCALIRNFAISAPSKPPCSACAPAATARSSTCPPSAAAAYPLGTPDHSSKWAVEGFTEALHFELLPLGIRTKIVEPGGVNTDFSARSFVFTDAPDLDDYRPMLDARKNSSGTPGKIEPEEVAEVIWTAVADGTSRLRYLAGDGARTVLGQRYSAEHDEAFVAGVRSRFGLRAKS